MTAAEISVIVPVLRDAAAARRLLSQLERTDAIETIVVDGDRDAELDAIVAARTGARLLRTMPGRAHQMNAGAAAATAAWLLFLHADSTVPAGWREAIVNRSRNDAVGGWFTFGLDDAAWQARVIERLVAWRIRLFRLPYGDQGLFVRRDVFAALGGFRPLPLMEDVEFARRLVKAGPVIALPHTLLTSSRRWRGDGWLRRSVMNVALVTMYFAGVSPARLARWYGGRGSRLGP